MSEAGASTHLTWRQRYEQVGRSADAYGIVLALLFLLLAIPPFLGGDSEWEAIVVTVLLGSVVTLSLVASRVRVWLAGLALVAWLASLFSVATSTVGHLGPGGYVLGVLLMVSPLAILNRIARHTTVTAQTVFGALCVYLELGFAFALVFRTFAGDHPGAFNGVGEVTPTTFTYFSFVTLATLGYGDITPAHDVARMLAVVETLVGQIFLVVVVARLVSLLGARRFRDRNATPGDDEPRG